MNPHNETVQTMIYLHYLTKYLDFFDTFTMILKQKIAKRIKFTSTKICEDYYFKCMALKKVGAAFCVKNYLTTYRIRKNSLQSNRFRNFYWIWKINNNYNRFSFLKNITSLIFISLNSIKKYGFK